MKNPPVLPRFLNKKISWTAVITGAILIAVFLVGHNPFPANANQINNCDAAPQVATLNPFPLKFSDDEPCRDYPVVSARLTNGNWPQNITELINGITAQAGDEIVVRIYVHNGAVVSGNPAVTTARNVRVRTTVDSVAGSFHSISVIAASDNTNTVQGSFNIHTGPNDRLVIMADSGQRFDYFAKFISGGLDIANATFNLGDIRACFEFSQFLVFRIKVETSAPKLQPSGNIFAQPNPCIITQINGLCVSNITWTTSNVSRAQVWVSQSGGPEKLFDGNKVSCSGTNCPAPWIQDPPNFYDFNLYDYSTGSRGVKLSSVRVTAVVQLEPTIGPLVCNFTWSSPVTADGTALRKIGETSNVAMSISGATPSGIVLIKNTNLTTGVTVTRQIQTDANGVFTKALDNTPILSSEGYAVGTYKTELTDLGTNSLISCKSFIIQPVVVSEATLNVDLTAAVNSVNFSQTLSGTAPFSGVDLRADVGGTAAGTINYTFYCNRTDPGTNITAGFNAKFDGSNDNPKITNDTCNYPTAGTFMAKVIVERGGLAAQDQVVITVTAPSVTPITTTVACSPLIQTVSVNQTATFTASGGNGVFSWLAPGGVPSAGSGLSFSTNYASAGTNNITVVSGGQSAFCTVSVAQVSNPVPAVDLKVNSSDGPVTINSGSAAVLTWASTNATTCSASAIPALITWTGSKSVSNTSGESTGALTQGTTFFINCAGAGGSAADSVIVFVTAPSVSPTPTPTPSATPFFTPFPSPLTCSPPFRTVALNQTLNFAGSGGTGPYTWIALNGSTISGVGLTFSTSFNQSGFKNVVFRDSTGASTGCIVEVTGQVNLVIDGTIFPQSNLRLTIQKFARNISRGETIEKMSVIASPGDTIEFTIRIRTLSQSQIFNVIVQDVLPGGLNYISRTTSLDGRSFPDGVAGTGLNIGSLTTNQELIVRLSARVASAADFGFGAVSLTNTAYVSADSVPQVSAQVPVTISPLTAVPISGIQKVARIKTGGEAIFIAALASAVLSLALIFYGQTYFAQRRRIAKAASRHLKDKSKFNFAS